MRNLLRPVGIVFLFILLGAFSGHAIEPGNPVPAFTVVFPGEDGDHLFTERDLPGTITVLFYESRHTASETVDLKHAIRDFQETSFSRPVLRIVQVIDASSANVLTRTIWKRKIRENAERYGAFLYADWTGKMRRDFGFSPKVSNILVVDPKGVVRFVHQGPLNDEKRAQLFTILRLLGEEFP